MANRSDSWRRGQHRNRQDLRGTDTGWNDTKYGGQSASKPVPTVQLAQAPSGGIPARVGATPGAAVCTQVIVAPLAGSGFSAGDLVKTAKTFTVINWDTIAHGADGDRIIQVSSHSDNAQLIGSSCVNEGTASSILLYAPTE